MKRDDRINGAEGVLSLKRAKNIGSFYYYI